MNFLFFKTYLETIRIDPIKKIDQINIDRRKKRYDFPYEIKGNLPIDESKNYHFTYDNNKKSIFLWKKIKNKYEKILEINNKKIEKIKNIKQNRKIDLDIIEGKAWNVLYDKLDDSLWFGPKNDFGPTIKIKYNKFFDIIPFFGITIKNLGKNIDYKI